MRINPNFWFLLSIILIITQYYFFPIDLFYSNFLISSMLYAVLPILFCFFGLSRISTYKEIFYPPKKLKPIGLGIKVVVYLIAFLSSVVICLIFVPKKLDRILIENGVVEHGLISEINDSTGSGIVQIKAIVQKTIGDEYRKDIKLNFEDLKLKADLPDMICKGRFVEIIHREGNFSSAKILCTEKDYVKYKKLKNDFLNLIDLENIFYIDKGKRLAYLNAKSGYWRFFSNENFEKIYINYIKGEKIVFTTDNKSLTYYKIGGRSSNFEMNKEVLKLDYNIKEYKNISTIESTGVIDFDPNEDSKFGFMCKVFK